MTFAGAGPRRVQAQREPAATDERQRAHGVIVQDTEVGQVPRLRVPLRSRAAPGDRLVHGFLQRYASAFSAGIPNTDRVRTRMFITSGCPLFRRKSPLAKPRAAEARR